jgi:Prokaryotic Cytochrome C oxidase subunit IV
MDLSVRAAVPAAVIAMTHWVFMPLQRTWLLLVGATVTVLWMREDGLAGLTIGTATLAIAYAKARLVILDFMELRHAPLLWRCLLECWLLLVSGLLVALYAGSRI